MREVNYPGRESGGLPLTFDLNRKVEDLRTLENQNTLRLLRTAQIYDIGIILGTLVFFISLTILILHPIKEHKIPNISGRITFFASLS